MFYSFIFFYCSVSEFSKKTGDFPCLSVVDMKVMALTYQLEKEFVGTDHLNTSPAIQTTIENFNPADVTFDNVAGFYSKDKVCRFLHYFMLFRLNVVGNLTSCTT